MKKSSRIIVILLVVFIAGLLALWYFREVLPYTPKYKWTASYYYNDDQPYGTKILYESLKASHEKKDFDMINKSFNKQFKWKGTNNCYIFIGNNYGLTEQESDSLFRFVEKGNIAFISTEYLNWDIMEKLFPEEHTESKTEMVSSSDVEEVLPDSVASDSIDSLKSAAEESEYFIMPDKPLKRVEVHLFDSLQTGKVYPFHYQYLKDTIGYDFISLNPRLLDSEKYPHELVSYLDSTQKVNCMSVKYGKGRIYIHTNPIFFTNYFLSKQNGFNHANTVLSFVGDRKIYWDEINKVREYNRDGNYYNYSAEDGPFRYLLSQKSFRWAWYLLLGALVLFLIFGSKRRQKAIPLIETDKNSSLAYVKAVAANYYKPRSHSAIAEEMWHLFCVFVKTKYGIDLKTDEKNQLEPLAKASKVDLQMIEKIIKLKRHLIYMFDGSKNAQLVELQQLLEEFYKKTK